MRGATATIPPSVSPLRLGRPLGNPAGRWRGPAGAPGPDPSATPGSPPPRQLRHRRASMPGRRESQGPPQRPGHVGAKSPQTGRDADAVNCDAALRDGPPQHSGLDGSPEALSRHGWRGILSTVHRQPNSSCTDESRIVHGTVHGSRSMSINPIQITGLSSSDSVRSGRHAVNCARSSSSSSTVGYAGHRAGAVSARVRAMRLPDPIGQIEEWGCHRISRAARVKPGESTRRRLRS